MSLPTSTHEGTVKHTPSAVFGPRNEQLLDITLGNTETSLGVLHHFRDGSTECSRFTLDRGWLSSPRYFTVSPELRRHDQGHWRKPPGGRGSPFVAAVADTQPDGFARALIERTLDDRVTHGHRLLHDESIDLVHLCAVHDFCRLGALRVRPQHAQPAATGRLIDLPTHVDLDPMLEAAAAFERGAADLRQRMFLFYCASALGGSRPKICFLQEDKTLAVAKFPSVLDEHPVTKAEMLGYELAKAAGIRVAQAQLKNLRTGPVLIVQRFDRGEGGGRKPYLSAQSLLLAEEGEVVSCLELLNSMRACCKDFITDARELWRRLMFKLLINSVEAELRKIGFLYVGDDRWRLAPAIDMTPSVKPRLPSTAAQIAEQGPQCDVQSLLGLSATFALPRAEALGALTTLVDAISRWRTVASQFAVGMKPDEIDRLEGVMNNKHFQQAKDIVGALRTRA
jgi:serine/threonine-protein kinase HipA